MEKSILLQFARNKVLYEDLTLFAPSDSLFAVFLLSIEQRALSLQEERRSCHCTVWL